MIGISITEKGLSATFTGEDIDTPKMFKNGSRAFMKKEKDGTILIQLIAQEGGPKGFTEKGQPGKSDRHVVQWARSTVPGIRSVANFGLTESSLFEVKGIAEGKEPKMIEMIMPEVRRAPIRKARPGGIVNHPQHGSKPNPRVELGTTKMKPSSIMEVEQSRSRLHREGRANDVVIHTIDHQVDHLRTLPTLDDLAKGNLAVGDPPRPPAISLRQAVEAINNWKIIHGGDLALEICANGKLKALVEYGG